MPDLVTTTSDTLDAPPTRHLAGRLMFPAPIEHMPAPNQRCYIPDPSNVQPYMFNWYGSDQHRDWLKRRLVHLVEANAAMHCNAMLEITT